MEVTIESEGLPLAGHLVRSAAAGVQAPPGLILCHGIPTGPGGAATSAKTFPALANRLVAETGWTVLTFNFRGTGKSAGNFSLRGWLADLDSAMTFLLDAGVSGVWLAGAGTGGALCLWQAATDERVRGVATLAAPATFDVWAAHPRRFLDHARSIGVIPSRAFPADVDAWARELTEIRALDVVAEIPPRPLLLMHGSDDDAVPSQDARTLATAAGNQVELRLIHGAGHRLRHDPRAVAFLMGWMDRQTAA